MHGTDHNFFCISLLEARRLLNKIIKKITVTRIKAAANSCGGKNEKVSPRDKRDDERLFLLSVARMFPGGQMLDAMCNMMIFLCTASLARKKLCASVKFMFKMTRLYYKKLYLVFLFSVKIFVTIKYDKKCRCYGTFN